jgi:hypothetical protein
VQTLRVGGEVRLVDLSTADGGDMPLRSVNPMTPVTCLHHVIGVPVSIAYNFTTFSEPGMHDDLQMYCIIQFAVIGNDKLASVTFASTHVQKKKLGANLLGEAADV